MKRRAKTPEPMTSADIDVAGLDGFMLNAQRLLASELWALSTGDEFKAAMGLWCRAWQQTPAGSLPNDPRILASFASLTRNRWESVKGMALRGFVLCSDGRLYHRVLCDEVRTAYEKRQAYRKRRDDDRERLRRWREGKTDSASSDDKTDDETRFATRVETDEKLVRQGQGQEYREGGDAPLAAAAGAASRPEGGDAKPIEADALALRAAPRSAAAASTEEEKVNPDANAKLRAMLGKYGLAASPQATLEWEGMLKRHGMTKWTEVRSFIAYCVKRGGVTFARNADPILPTWMREREGATP